MSATITGVLIVLGLIVYYASSCVFWPYSRCLRCKGEARHSAWWGGGFSLCGWCGGTGRRLKAGRWIYNYIRGKQKGAR